METAHTSDSAEVASASNVRAASVGELQRFAAVQRYGVLDSPPDAIFDWITATASAVCDTPIALITLLDPDRQWFLSRVGIDLTETPRDVSVCHHAIKKPRVLTEVPDMRKDDRFKENPLVVGKHQLNYYAGRPLLTPDGHALGTLCVLGKKPQTLTPLQRNTLERLARLVMLLLEERISSPVSVIGRAIEDRMPNGVIITSPQRPGNPITFCNKGFEDLTGYTFAEVAGKNCRFLQGEGTSKEHIEMIRNALVKNESITLVIKNYRKNGTEFWNELTLSPIVDGAGQLRYYLGFQYDVTERVKAQDALASSHAGLQKSLDIHSEVSDSLASANVALQKKMSQRVSSDLQSLKLQNELLHVGRLTTMGEMATGLAHELNQPLLVISQCADTAMMVARESDSSNAILLECLNDIQTETQRAGEIIRALRQFITRDTSERCAVDINALVHQSVRLTKNDARARNIKLLVIEGDIPQPFIDRVQIAQVLVNLLRNSIDAIASLQNKISSDNEHMVTVETQLLDESIVVSVTDTGPGFETGIEPFKAFETNKESGLGIGLSICRSIIESHQGELYLDRNLDTGCRMQFTLPTKLCE